MPTYQDALKAEPSEFLAYASEMTAAATDLATQQTDYGAKVAEINGHWQDAANEAFNGEVGNVNAHLTQVIAEVTAAAGSLSASGLQMLAECTAMTVADAALKATGFDVQPAPLVTLGALQRTAIAMAGPFGGVIEAALQAQAAAGTLGLQTLLSLVNAADATAGAVLTQAAELLKPLDDKANGTGKDLESLAMAEDHSTAGAEDEEEASEEDEEQEEESEEAEEEPTEPEQDQQQEPTQPQTQQPTTPQTPSGMEDLAQPEIPDLENPWDASELPDPDEPSGGLASGLGAGGAGGGLGGGGLGGGGLAAGAGAVPQGGMGVGAMTGAPAGGGAVGAGAGAGAGKGTGGGMMGASGGGRGAGGNHDDEVTRESILTEDPDEDVWGIGKAADDQYE